jgi:acetyl esterase
VLLVIIVAALLVVPTALAVLGTYLYDVPFIGLATAYVPWYLPWLMLASMAGGVLALINWRMRRGRIGAVLAVVASLTVAGASVIDARMIAAVEHKGADIRLIDTFGVGVPKHAAPDDEATYGTFEGQPLRLAVFRPRESASRAPVLVYIHGGGWVAGGLTARSTDLRWFAEQGYELLARY